MNQEQLNFQREWIAATFTARRLALNLEIEDLAEPCEMQPNTLKRIFEGKMWPNMKQVILICDALKIGLVLQT